MIITIIIWNIQFIVPLSFIGREVVTSIPGVPDRSLGRKHGGKIKITFCTRALETSRYLLGSSWTSKPPEESVY